MGALPNTHGVWARDTDNLFLKGKIKTQFHCPANHGALFKDLFLIIDVCACVYRCMRRLEASDSPGTEVPGGSGPPDLGSENQSQVLCNNSVCALDY